jgi:hypothetical protein
LFVYKTLTKYDISMTGIISSIRYPKLALQP